ncbi:hypothetical protein K2D_19150 [Enterococcus hirae]|nr:hypothetical protein K2D_19150 [Enterococcus hirae]
MFFLYFLIRVEVTARYSIVPLWGGVGVFILIVSMLFAAILLFELIGLINEKHQYILKTLRFLGNKEYRTQVIQKYKRKWTRH